MRIFAGFHYNTIAVVRFAAVAFLLIAESASQGLPASDVHSDDFYYIANTQLDQIRDGKAAANAAFNPIAILRVALKY